MDVICLSCRFWSQVRIEGPGVPNIPGTAAQGECKRYVLWPLTAPTDMCGEWMGRD
jgi:hypothetical protein